MAENILIAPFLNPVDFYDIDPVQVPAYLTKHFDDYLYAEQVAQYPNQEQTKYFQPWQTSDTIYFQYQSNFSPITIELVDYKGKVYVSIALNNSRANIYEPGMYVFQGGMSLTGIPDGCYFLRRLCGDPSINTSISGPLSIKAVHTGSKRVDYSNNRFHEDVIFETGIVFSIRNYGALWYDSPGAQISAYQDQKLDPYILSSKPFRVFLFSVGDSFGCPVTMLDKYNRIFTCNSVAIDDKPFSCLDNFKINQTSQDGTLMQGVNMLLREGINRASKVITTTSNPNKKLNVVYNLETKIFGILNVGGADNTIPIKSVE